MKTLVTKTLQIVFIYIWILAGLALFHSNFGPLKSSLINLNIVDKVLVVNDRIMTGCIVLIKAINGETNEPNK